MSISRVICDTDILSEVLKHVDPLVVARAEAYRREHRTFAFTSATVMEVLYGFHRKNAYAQASRIECALQEHLEIVPEKDDYRLAAQILGTLDRQGTPIGRIDPLIAACALNRNLPLATGNIRHFGYVQAAGYPLRLEDRRSA